MLEKPLRVGELAKRSGKTVRALHLYEELGLLNPVHRSKGGFRLYSPLAVQRVEWISKLQDAGFSLHDLQDLPLDGVSEQATWPRWRWSGWRVRRPLARHPRAAQEARAAGAGLTASLAYLEGCRSCRPSQHQIERAPELQSQRTRSWRATDSGRGHP